MLKLKTYYPAEERLNVWTHGIAALAAVPGFLWMLSRAHTALEIFCAAVYCGTIMVTFSCSACYHAAVKPKPRLLLRRTDHAAIYLLISGTYTPLFLVGCGGITSAVILSISWGIAVLGMTKELCNFKLPKWVSIVSYLVSGWLCITVVNKLIAVMGAAGLSLLIAGGVAYTAGVPFYLSRKRYAHAIWHVFCIAGVVLHFLAILTLYK